MPFTKRSATYEHEVFKHIEPEHHEAFKIHIATAVEKMQANADVNFESPGADEIEVPSLVTEPAMHSVHQSYFKDTLIAHHVTTALKAAEQLINGSGKNTRLDIKETNLQKALPIELWELDQRAMARRYMHRLALGHTMQAKTRWGKETETTRMKTFFDYFHKKLEEAKVEKI